ncbi:MAG: hypothetical protein CMP53_08450 [Flavobacteriales bacterium]|nr:hypothetical protein [Flavobacteriales bacterium]|tara:strand:- start:5987 stop:6322 length:336 start_codon:yes stop_codon:yes gene_type:complete
MNKYLLLPLFLAFIACEKDTSPDLFYYDETGCADAWWVDAPPIDTLTMDIYEEYVASYLENNNVEVLSFNVTYDSTVAQVCMACFCKTGKVLQIEVQSGKKRKMRQLGFYQ